MLGIRKLKLRAPLAIAAAVHIRLRDDFVGAK
jgi:hypothetical protein